jgi:hypothetical protein
MLVYRVEHPDGAGPYGSAGGRSYRENVFGRELCIRHSDERHPAPWADGINFMTEDDFCALVSEERLREWFDDSWEDLSSLGYFLRVYDVADKLVKVGESGQCVFKKHRATLVREEIIGRPVKSNLAAWLENMATEPKVEDYPQRWLTGPLWESVGATTDTPVTFEINGRKR